LSLIKINLPPQTKMKKTIKINKKNISVANSKN
jgi:hypothetical protein